MDPALTPTLPPHKHTPRAAVSRDIAWHSRRSRSIAEKPKADPVVVGTPVLGVPKLRGGGMVPAVDRSCDPDGTRTLPRGSYRLPRQTQPPPLFLLLLLLLLLSIRQSSSMDGILRVSSACSEGWLFSR